MKIYILKMFGWYIDGYGDMCPSCDYSADIIGYYSSKEKAKDALNKAIDKLKTLCDYGKQWHVEVINEDFTQMFTRSQDYIDLTIDCMELDSDPMLGD